MHKRERKVRDGLFTRGSSIAPNPSKILCRLFSANLGRDAQTGRSEATVNERRERKDAGRAVSLSVRLKPVGFGAPLGPFSWKIKPLDTIT